ncbi:MAG: efflux RND transporter permease subunit, partial [Bacteroidales bacterium]|nr:efflux RND transporter permease subunit [Bacteroidales bacterium]
MSIYESSVRKPVTTALIFVAVIIIGIFSYTKLSVDYFPEMDAPFVSVITFYPGAGAEDIEVNISKLLEDNLNSVSDLKNITSTSKDNVSMVMIEFEWGTNLDEATNDVRDAVSRIEKNLPEGIEKPIILRFNTSMMPIMFITAMANESYNALGKVLDDVIAKPLARIDGIGAVSIGGGAEREIQVNVDPKVIEAYNMSVEQIGQLIAAENLNLPTGAVDVGSNNISMRVQGEFYDAKQIEDIQIANFQGKAIYIKDVATVKDTIKDLSQIVSANGERSAVIIITKQSGANTVEICKKIREQLPVLSKNLPPDVSLNIRQDNSENVVASINSLTETIYLAMLFVVIVILFFIGNWRSTIIVIVTIPVSLVTAFIYLFVTGNTINIISLSSLSIAIGMVVDDAIVVLENITTHIERGSSPREAAIYATNEVGVAVIAASLTIVAVFLPLTFLGGMAGIMFKQLGWIVTIIIAVSTVAALSLTPMMSSIMLKAKKKEKKTTFFNKLYAPIGRGLDKFDSAYSKFLGWAVRHRIVVMIAAGLLFVSSLLLLKFVGTDFMPKTDDSQIRAIVELPIGTRKEVTSEFCNKIQAEFMEKYKDHILNIQLQVGAADENNLFSSFSKNGTNIGTFNIKLVKPRFRDKTSFEVADIMRNDVARYPEIHKFSVISQSGGFGGGSTADLAIKIFGFDIDKTTELANELKERMKTVSGTRDVDISRQEMKLEYKLELDRAKLSAAGLTTVAVSTAIRNRINGLVASKFREDGDEYDIMVRFDRPFREGLENIESIVVYNSAGKGVKIRELGQVVERYMLPEITRENRQRIVSVTCNVEGRALGDVTADVLAEVDKM